jgi:hypothetical protein
MVFCYDCQFENRSVMCLGSDGRRDFDRLAAAYLDELSARERHGLRPLDSWAWECVNELEFADPKATLFFVLTALDRLTAETQACASILAAGPLETILANFGSEIIDAVEAIARRSAKFRYLLSGVWGRSRMDARVWRRIRAVLAAGPVMDDDHRTPGYGIDLAGATEGDVVALIGTSVMDDLGGATAAARIIGLR